jgi:hypothetical protein
MESSQYSPDLENSQLPVSKEPLPVRVFAHLISYVFHPIFISAYVAAFLLYVHPYAFAGFDDRMRMLRLLSVLVSTCLLPAFSVFLLWRLEFIQSIFLRTQKERIYMYVIAMIFYFWVWYVFNNLPDSPVAIRQFLLGAFLGICISWMANIWMLVSMHSTAVGGMLTFFLIQLYKDPYMSGTYLSIALVITGLVCTARLILGGHSRTEVYTGLLIGALAQLAAIVFT